MIAFSVDASDLQELTRRLRREQGGKLLRQDMARELRAAAGPAKAAVQQAVSRIPDKPGGASSGLKRRTRRSVTTQVRTTGRRAGVSVRISRRAMGAQAGAVAASNSRRWRHPVFGNRDVWVTQPSAPGWFDVAARGQAPSVRRQLRRVLDNTERRITGKG